MRCLGRTRTLRRCSRETDRYLCHDHRWQPYKFIFSIVSGFVLLASFYQYAVKPLFNTWFPEIPQLPEFTIATTRVDLPGRDEKQLSFSQIHNRRLHILTIKNTNKIQLSNMELWVQFPEAILNVKSPEKSASYEVEAAENWDKQPIVVTGDASESLSVEPFATEEKTGLWRVTVNTLPADNKIKIEFLTTTGPEGGELYTEGVTQAEAQKADDELIWLIQGSYQFTTDMEVGTEQIVVPLEFDRKNRNLTALPVSRGPLKETNWVHIRHGRGARIPGIVSTLGYLVVKSRKGQMYIAPVRLERINDIDAKFGLFGWPPENPGFEVRFKQGDR